MSLYIFDLDGTLFRGESPLPGAVATVQTLLDRGHLVRYATNNSSKTLNDVGNKLAGMGFPVEPSWVMTSARMAAQTLCGQVTHAHFVGEVGIEQALIEAGIDPFSPNPEAVVIGIDRQFTYDKLRVAMQHLADPAVRFIATNRDLTYPLEGGVLIPGAGSLVAALAACSGREPEVMGKPNPAMILALMSEAGASPQETWVVGDRIDTDIEAGRAAGAHVHLVLSGVTATAPPGLHASPDLTALI